METAMVVVLLLMCVLAPAMLALTAVRVSSDAVWTGFCLYRWYVERKDKKLAASESSQLTAGTEAVV